MSEFNEWFKKGFTSEYIEDGDWHRFELYGSEFGSAPNESHVREFEEYSLIIAETAWDFQQKEIQSLKEKLSKYESGHKGACSTCEFVGELNVELGKRLEEAVNIFHRLNTLKHHGIDEECWRWEDWLTQNNQTKGEE